MMNCCYDDDLDLLVMNIAVVGHFAVTVAVYSRMTFAIVLAVLMDTYYVPEEQKDSSMRVVVMKVSSPKDVLAVHVPEQEDSSMRVVVMVSTLFGLACVIHHVCFAG